MFKSKSIFICTIATVAIFFASSCSSSEAGSGIRTEPLPPTTLERPTGESLASTTLNSPAQFFEVEIYDLKSIDAVNQLNLTGKSGEEICDDRHSLEMGIILGNSSGDIPDYAERKLGSLIPLVTAEASGIFAIAAAGLVYKSYETIARAWENPKAEELLCISRLIAQPRLEKDWINFRHLLRTKKTVRGGATPFRLATAGVRSGEAVVVGCLPANAYGTIYGEDGTPERTPPTSDQSFLFESTLAWIGGRWRIQTLNDHYEMNCDDIDQLISKNHERFASDIAEGFDDWMLSSTDKKWNWTEEEINKWLNL